jgi:hypothetical protein
MRTVIIGIPNDRHCVLCVLLLIDARDGQDIRHVSCTIILRHVVNEEKAFVRCGRGYTVVFLRHEPHRTNVRIIGYLLWEQERSILRLSPVLWLTRHLKVLCTCVMGFGKKIDLGSILIVMVLSHRKKRESRSSPYTIPYHHTVQNRPLFLFRPHKDKRLPPHVSKKKKRRSVSFGERFEGNLAFESFGSLCEAEMCPRVT